MTHKEKLLEIYEISTSVEDINLPKELTNNIIRKRINGTKPN